MKHNYLILFSILLSVFCSACKNQLTPESIPQSTVTTDTLVRTITPGVTVRFESVKDSYTLEDTIFCHLVLHNDTSSSPFIIDASYPAYRFRVTSQETGDIVAFAPLISYDTDEHDTLRVGDSLAFNIKWTQNIYSSINGSSGLKTFSGKYLLEAEIIGNSLLLPLNKYIVVTDVGNPLSADLEMNYASTDSVNAAMTVRNRQSIKLNCTIASSTPIQVVFLAIPNLDTTLIERWALSANEIAFPPHSDSLLFIYKVARSDARFNHFKGGYNIILTLFFQSEKVTCSSIVFF